MACPAAAEQQRTSPFCIQPDALDAPRKPCMACPAAAEQQHTSHIASKLMHLTHLESHACSTVCNSMCCLASILLWKGRHVCPCWQSPGEAQPVARCKHAQLYQQQTWCKSRRVSHRRLGLVEQSITATNTCLSTMVVEVHRTQVPRH